MKVDAMYDVSFWEPPDWRKESSFDPLFLAVVGASLVLLAMLAWFSWNFQTRLTLKGRILTMTAANDRIAKQADRVRAMRRELETWKRTAAALEWKHRARILWCRQLAAFQRTVPDAILLSNFNYTSRVESVPITALGVGNGSAAEKAGSNRKSRRKPQLVPVITGQVILSGIGFGRDAAEAINRFSRSLQLDSELKNWISKAEILDVGPAQTSGMLEGGDGAKAFTLECDYKPIRWFYVPKTK